MSSICPEPSPGGRTRIIAHRGASGYLPEHTLAAKSLAFGLGADFIEQDVVATSDRQLVVLHDIHLDDVSDVASRFPDRARDDGHYYVIDFTKAELDELALAERRQPGGTGLQFPGRFPYSAPAFRIASFDDEIRLISGLNASTGRHVGIYPEIKDPAWHAEAGIDIARLVVDTLSNARELLSGPVFVQSFDAATLIRLRHELDVPWPLVQLLDTDGAERVGADPSALAAIADYAAGVGLPYMSLMSRESDSGRLLATQLAADLRAAGLLVHPYTLRRDSSPPDAVDYADALRFLIHELEVDAIFCDFPDDGVCVRDASGV